MKREDIAWTDNMKITREILEHLGWEEVEVPYNQFGHKTRKAWKHKYIQYYKRPVSLEKALETQRIVEEWCIGELVKGGELAQKNIMDQLK